MKNELITFRKNQIEAIAKLICPNAVMDVIPVCLVNGSLAKRKRLLKSFMTKASAGKV